MSHYTFATDFRAVYERALARYSKGDVVAATLLSPEDTAFLAANGITAQHLFDYAEDFAGEGEPKFEQAIGIELVRRDYFLNVQLGRPSLVVLDPATLPPRSATAGGIEWLPRILPKARAKLGGELSPSIMYCCGGDRAFFRKHDILPQEFLALVWRHERDEAAIVEWVVRRSSLTRK